MRELEVDQTPQLKHNCYRCLYFYVSVCVYVLIYVQRNDNKIPLNHSTRIVEYDYTCTTIQPRHKQIDVNTQIDTSHTELDTLMLPDDRIYVSDVSKPIKCVLSPYHLFIYCQIIIDMKFNYLRQTIFFSVFCLSQSQMNSLRGRILVQNCKKKRLFF